MTCAPARRSPMSLILPVSFMDGMDAMGSTVPGTRTSIGRVTIGLAVHKGDPHPDISTPDKLAAALKAGGTVIYSDPASGSMEARIINDMLRQNAVFKGVKRQDQHQGRGRPGGDRAARPTWRCS